MINPTITRWLAKPLIAPLNQTHILMSRNGFWTDDDGDQIVK